MNADTKMKIRKAQAYNAIPITSSVRYKCTDALIKSEVQEESTQSNQNVI